MPREIIRRSGGVVREYNPPELFEKINKYQLEDDKFAYVEEELIRMARDGTLSITDLHNQDAFKVNTAGMVILGQYIDGDTREMRYKAPPTEMLMDDESRPILIKIRSIKKDGDGNLIDIRWKQPMKPQGKVFGSANTNKRPRFEEVWFNENAVEVDLPLGEAWLLLHQQGKYCVPVRRKGLQDKFWLVEEVRPEPQPMLETGPETKQLRTKRGRSSRPAEVAA